MKTVLIALLVLLSSCGNGEEGGKVVQTAKVKRRTIIEKVEGLGQIKPELEVKVTSDVAGRIVEINGLPGDKVKKGDVLVRIDPKNYLNALESSRSSLESAEASLKKAKAELSRAKELFGKGFASQAELDVAQASYEVQLASRKQAKSNVDNAAENLRKCTIKSPIDGVITVKNKELGEIAQGSSFTLDVIMLVANLSSMETLVDVTENDIVKIKIGQDVDLEVDAFPNKTFKGRVKEIANSAKVDQSGQAQVTNFEVKIAIVDNNLAFRPGMNVTAQVKTKVVEDVLSIPIQSVTARVGTKAKLVKSGEEQNRSEAEEKDKDFLEKADDIKDSKKMEEVVFLVAGKKVEQRKVMKGISDDDYYQVLSGLDEGDEVVIGPFRMLSSRLKDGSRVKVKNDSPKKSKSKDE